MTLSICTIIILALALDTLLDLLAVMMALRMTERPVQAGRVLASAFFGSITALAAQIAQLTHGLRAAIALPAAMVMARIAFGGGMGWRRTLRAGLLVLFCSGFLGGTIGALYAAGGSLPAAGFLGGALACAVFVGAIREKRACCAVTDVYVTCTYRGKRFSFAAMADSGNTLRDYLTHRPVIVASERAVAEMAGIVTTRPIFADTAGGRRMMRLFVPEDTVLKVRGVRCRVSAAIALSRELDGGARALVPASLLENVDI